MKTTIIEYSCDVCCKKAETKKESIQVVFTTEQTEGRQCEPYLSIQKIDICQDCKDRILKGDMLFGAGAQGYNRYVFNHFMKQLQHFKNSTVGLWATDRIDLFTYNDKEKYFMFEIKE